MRFKNDIRSYFVIEDRGDNREYKKLKDFRSYFIIEKRKNKNRLGFLQVGKILTKISNSSKFNETRRNSMQ